MGRPKGQGGFSTFKMRAGCSPFDTLLALPLSLNYHQISSNTHLISSAAIASPLIKNAGQAKRYDLFDIKNVFVWSRVFTVTNVIQFYVVFLSLLCNQHKLSRVMRKLAFCIWENKGAYQLHGNHAANQHLFHYIESTIHLLLKSKISSL